MSLQKHKSTYFIIVSVLLLGAIIYVILSRTQIGSIPLPYSIEAKSSLLINTGTSDKKQYVIDFEKKSIISLDRNLYYGGIKDGDNKYWLISSNNSKTNIDIYDENRLQKRMVREGANVYQAICCADSPFVVYAELAKEHISHVTLFDLEGNETDSFYLDYYVWDLKYKNHTIYIAGHHLDEDYGVIIAYDYLTREKSITRVHNQYIPVKLLIDSDGTVFSIHYNHRSSTAKGVLLVQPVNSHAYELPIDPEPINMTIHDGNVYTFHKSLLTSGNVINSTSLENRKSIKKDIEAYDRIVFEDDFILLISQDKKRIDKYTYDLELLDRYHLDFYHHAVIIPMD